MDTDNGKLPVVMAFGKGFSAGGQISAADLSKPTILDWKSRPLTQMAVCNGSLAVYDFGSVFEVGRLFMPAFLVPIDPGHCLIPLEKAVVLIGRQADCDVSLTNSRKISRKHCCIAQVNNRFIVRDLGSTNGVYLNGNRISKEAELTAGDQLTIGDVRFQVQNEATISEKKKTVKKSEPVRQVEPPREIEPVASTPAPAPVLNRALVTPARMDDPVVLEEGEKDFAVESTNHHALLSSRKSRPNDVVPIDQDAESDEDQPIGLISDVHDG